MTRTIGGAQGPTSLPSVFRLAGFAAALSIAACLLASCGSDQSAKPELSTGLDALDDPSKQPPPGSALDGETDAETANRLSLMEQAMKGGTVSVDAPAKPAPRKPPIAKAEANASEPAEPIAGDDAEPSESAEAPAKAPPANKAADEQAELVSQLAAALRDKARSSSVPAAALLQLAALELVQPEAGAPDPDAESALSPREREFLEAWRTLFASARDHASDADPAQLATQVAALAESLQASQSLAALNPRLCLRVDGFGSYDELKRSRPSDPYVFVAGRRAKMIVYVELQNFAHQPKKQGGVDGFAVKLTQALDLFQDAAREDRPIWTRPAQEITDFSRSRRRDFFVTQIIELPPTLAAGSYRMKITMTDQLSDAVAEAVVPITLLAEGSPLTR